MTDEAGTIFDTIETLMELADYMMEKDSESISTESKKDDKEKIDDEVKDVFHICDQCSFQTDDLEYFTFHVLDEKHQYSCITCSLKVSKPGNLKKHSLRQHGMMKYLNCDECAFKAQSRELLHSHRFKAHISNTYSCVTCNKSYDKAAIFCEHMRTHLKENNVKTSQNILKIKVSDREVHCPECPYLTSDKRNLVFHHRKHHGIQFLCTKCEFRGRSKGELEEHTGSKHEGALFICELCEYRTNIKRSLTKHKLKIHDKKYSCDKCGFCAVSTYALNEHIKGVHEQAYKCDVCSLNLSQDRNLKRHKESVHGRIV